MSNIIYVVGRVSRIRRTEMPNGRIAYNFGIASSQKHGNSEKTMFFDASIFAGSPEQARFYDSILVKGNRLPFLGYLTMGDFYVNDSGTTVSPWVLQVTQIGTGINKAFLVGNLTKDAVVTISKDIVIVRFTIAVNRNKNETDYIRVVKFGKGKFKDYACQYLTKGQAVIISGRITSGAYVSKNGERVYVHEVAASDIELYGNKNAIQMPVSPVKKQSIFYDTDIPEELIAMVI